MENFYQKFGQALESFLIEKFEPDYSDIKFKELDNNFDGFCLGSLDQKVNNVGISNTNIEKEKYVSGLAAITNPEDMACIICKDNRLNLKIISILEGNSFIPYPAWKIFLHRNVTVHETLSSSNNNTETLNVKLSLTAACGFIQFMSVTQCRYNGSIINKNTMITFFLFESQEELHANPYPKMNVVAPLKSDMYVPLIKSQYLEVITSADVSVEYKDKLNSIKYSMEDYVYKKYHARFFLCKENGEADIIALQKCKITIPQLIEFDKKKYAIINSEDKNFSICCFNIAGMLVKSSDYYKFYLDDRHKLMVQRRIVRNGLEFSLVDFQFKNSWVKINNLHTNKCSVEQFV